jgi:hypothetical protein
VVPNPVNKAKVHKMRIVYYQNPNWLEVYIDDSLYLVDKDFDPIKEIGGRDAYVGFTTGTSEHYSAPIEISNWTMETVNVAIAATRSVGYLATQEPATLQSAIAAMHGGDFGDDAQDQVTTNSVLDNNTTDVKPVVTINSDELATYTISTFDLCDNRVDSGGKAQWLDAALMRRPDVNETDIDPTSVTDTDISVRAPGAVTDHLDGTYSVSFTAVELGKYDLFLSFGPACNRTASNADVLSAHEYNYALQESGEACWTAIFLDVLNTLSPRPTAR